MLYYNRINISEGIDLPKSSNRKECMIRHYWFYNSCILQDSVCNACHDLTMVSVNKSDIAFITVKNVNYRCIICSISKSEVINLSKNYVLEDCVYI